MKYIAVIAFVLASGCGLYTIDRKAPTLLAPPEPGLLFHWGASRFMVGRTVLASDGAGVLLTSRDGAVRAFTEGRLVGIDANDNAIVLRQVKRYIELVRLPLLGERVVLGVVELPTSAEVKISETYLSGGPRPVVAIRFIDEETRTTQVITVDAENARTLLTPSNGGSSLSHVWSMAASGPSDTIALLVGQRTEADGALTPGELRIIDGRSGNLKWSHPYSGSWFGDAKVVVSANGGFVALVGGVLNSFDEGGKLRATRDMSVFDMVGMAASPDGALVATMTESFEMEGRGADWCSLDVWQFGDRVWNPEGIRLETIWEAKTCKGTGFAFDGELLLFPDAQ